MVYFLQHTLFLLFFTIHYISHKSTLPFISSEIQNDTLEEENKEKLPFRLPLTFLLETFCYYHEVVKWDGWNLRV